MRFIGYFPGIRFDADSQFGRQVHVREFIENTLDSDDVSATFVIGGPRGYFESEHVRAYGSKSVPRQLALEVFRTALLVYYVVSADEECVLYTRYSPYLAPLVAHAVTGACLVTEANGVPEEENGGSTGGLTDWLDGAAMAVRRAYREQSDLVIPVSESIEEHLVSTHDVGRIERVEPGVDVERFRPRGTVSDGPPYTICYVGGLQEWQGIERMIDVVSKLDTDVEFVIVGGEDDRIAALRRVAADARVEDRVRFVGRVPHEDVPEYVSRADLCFGPFSDTRKAAPLKIYEYLGSGREVVIAYNSGLDHFLEFPGVHRLTLEEGDALAPQIDSILDAVSVNHDGVEYVRQNHSWSSITRRILALCREVCS